MEEKPQRKLFGPWRLLLGSVLGLGPKPQAVQMCRLPGSSAKLIPTELWMQPCPCFPVLPKPGRGHRCTRGQVPSPEEPEEAWPEGEVGREKAAAMVSPFLCLMILPWLSAGQGLLPLGLGKQAEIGTRVLRSSSPYWVSLPNPVLPGNRGQTLDERPLLGCHTPKNVQQAGASSPLSYGKCIFYEVRAFPPPNGYFPQSAALHALP